MSELDEVVQGRLRLQRDLALEESIDVKVSGNEKNWMDLNRKQIKAYEYLCHIGEAKEWIEACSEQQLPPVVDLDEQLRNGVVLAKLAKQFKPNTVKRIFGEDVKLQFRHSDNINYFFQFCKDINLPNVFVFELTDLYDKKNIPKVIYNIHAIAHLLHQQRLAPAIHDLRGKLQFTDQELENTHNQIEMLNLPDFNNAASALAKEMNPFQFIQSHFNNNPADLELIQRLFKSRIQRHKHQQLIHTIHLQSLVRKYLVQSHFKAIKSNNYIPLQARIKAHLIHLHHQHIHKNLSSIQITPFQSRFRAHCQRSLFIKNSKLFLSNTNNYIQIQSLYRKHYIRSLFLQLKFNPTQQAIQFFYSPMIQSDSSQLRQSIIQHIKQVNELESTITDLDLKVSLILKNRINDIKKQPIIVPTLDLFKSNDKVSKHQQLLYSQMLYLLQTNPLYLSTIVLNQQPSEQIKKFIEQSIFSIFNYAQHVREEHLLLKLLFHIINIEINQISSINEFIKSNPQFTRLVVNYIRSAKDRQFLSSILHQPVLAILESELELELDPITLYKKLIVANETATGQKSSKPLDATRDVALLDPDVIVQLDIMKQHVHTFAVSFIKSITKTLPPFGIRCIAQQLYKELQRYNQPEQSLKIIANLIFFRYINPAIVAPEAFDVVQSDYTLTMQQRKNLSEVSKILNLITTNQYQSELFNEFSRYLVELMNVPELKMDEYQDYINKPTLYMNMNEIMGLHALLMNYEWTNEMHSILSELNKPTSIDDVLLQRPMQQHTIVLKSPNIQENQLDELKMETRRLILTSLDPSLITSSMMHLNQVDIKETIKLNLEQLKGHGLDETWFIKNIAKELLQQHQIRKIKELEEIKLNGTLQHLQTKIQYLKVQKEQYQQYIESCLNQLKSKKKQSQPLILSRQYYHLKQVKKDLGKIPAFGSFKYTAKELKEKGVLIEIDHPEVTVKQYDKIDITLSSDEAGLIDISVQYAPIKGMVIVSEREQLKLDELLQNQFEGQTVVTLFDMAKCNINLLIYLINKKFYK